MQILENPAHWREVVSNVSGSISLASWVIILLPQLIEQWRLKSADGVSIGFILAWFLGDLCNLAGSIWGQLRPNVILLAMWFCFSDTLLLVSYWYYKRLSKFPQPALLPIRRASPATAGSYDSEHAMTPPEPPTPATALLQERRDSFPQPAVPNGANSRRTWLLTTGLPAIFVIVVATLSYAISDSSEDVEPPSSSASGPEILGYISAVLYLLGRIPQILQNHRRRSVEGLSMGFFTLSIIGNLTYAGQVIIYRTDRPWLISYLPWLLGSLGTIAEDLVILAQFHMYNKAQ